MTKRRIPGVELRVHHVSPRGPHSASIMIIINRRCAKNRQKGGTVCVYLHMETRPLGNYFTAGTRGVFEHSLLHSKLEYPDLPQPPKCLPVTAVDRHQGNMTKRTNLLLSGAAAICGQRSPVPLYRTHVVRCIAARLVARMQVCLLEVPLRMAPAVKLPKH